VPGVAVALTRAEARRFLVRRHLLDPPRSLPADPASVLEVVRRLGLLQFDPLEVPGARNHDLVLHARVAGYRREWCDVWLYGPDRRLIELYNKSLNIVPLDELPWFRSAWERATEHYREGILRDEAAVAEAILERLTAEGPLSTAAFDEHGHAVDWWWAPTRAARAVMEVLFVTGRLGIARRDGNRRYYDLIERLVPGEVLAAREPAAAQARHRLLSRYRATGLGIPSAATNVMYGTGTADERRRLTAELVDDGTLTAVVIDGLRGTRYVLTSELPLLKAAADAAPATDPPAVAFIAPLDPLLWDRRLLRELFDFDYLWEVYVPEPKRRWGYYVLPILYRDRFVGRIEPRLDRRQKRLRVIGLSWEPGFRPRRERGFVDALRDALAYYLRFVNADAVDVDGPDDLYLSSIRPRRREATNRKARPINVR
jgi:uncharacterized protein